MIYPCLEGMRMKASKDILEMKEGIQTVMTTIMAIKGEEKLRNFQETPKENPMTKRRIKRT